MNRQLCCGLLGTVFAILLLQTVTPAFADWGGISFPSAPVLPVNSMSTVAWPVGDDATKCVIAARGGVNGNQIWVYAPWTSSSSPGNSSDWKLLYQNTLLYTTNLSIPRVTVTPSLKVCVAFVANPAIDAVERIVFVPFDTTTVFPFPQSYLLPWYWSDAFNSNPSLASSYAAPDPLEYGAPSQIRLDDLDPNPSGYGGLYDAHTSVRVALATRIPSTGPARFCFAVDAVIRFYDDTWMVDAIQYNPDSYFEMDATPSQAYANFAGRRLWGGPIQGIYSTIYPADRPEGKDPVALDGAAETAALVYRGGPEEGGFYGLYITRGGTPADQYDNNFLHSYRLAVAAHGADRRVFIHRNGSPYDILMVLSSNGGPFTTTSVSPLAFSDTSRCDAAWSPVSPPGFVHYWYPDGGGKQFYYYKPGAVGYYSSILTGGGVGVNAIGDTIAVRDTSCEVYVPLDYHKSPGDYKDLKFHPQLP